MAEQKMIEWVTTAQAGAMLGVTRWRIYQLVQEERLTADLIARRFMLISLDSLAQEAERRGIEV